MGFRILIGLLIIMGCKEDFLPAGLYDYQVEHLLSSDTLKKWQFKKKIVKDNETALIPCIDGTHLLISLENDTLLLSKIFSDCPSRLEDTTFIGHAKTSGYQLLFTDSLLFRDGTLWLLNKITSKIFIFSNEESHIIECQAN